MAHRPPAQPLHITHRIDDGGAVTWCGIELAGPVRPGPAVGVDRPPVLAARAATPFGRAVHWTTRDDFNCRACAASRPRAARPLIAAQKGAELLAALAVVAVVLLPATALADDGTARAAGVLPALVTFLVTAMGTAASSSKVREQARLRAASWVVALEPRWARVHGWARDALVARARATLADMTAAAADAARSSGPAVVMPPAPPPPPPPDPRTRRGALDIIRRVIPAMRAAHFVCVGTRPSAADFDIAAPLNFEVDVEIVTPDGARYPTETEWQAILEAGVPLLPWDSVRRMRGATQLGWICHTMANTIGEGTKREGRPS